VNISRDIYVHDLMLLNDCGSYTFPVSYTICIPYPKSTLMDMAKASPYIICIEKYKMNF